MKKLVVVTLMLVLALSSFACSAAGWSIVHGSGDVDEETYAVSGFDAVHFATVGTLHIEMGEEEGLRVEAEDNLLEYFEVEVKDGTLEIGTREFVSLIPTEPVHFYLTAKSLDSIAASGSGDVEVPALQASSFSVKISGSGDVSIGQLVANMLDVRISGSGGLFIADGEIGDQDVDVSGSGEYRAGGVKAVKAERISVKVSGSGKVDLGELDADVLDVRASGSGKVSAADGAVATQRARVSGSGRYEAKGVESAQAEIRISGSGSAMVWASERLDVEITGSGHVYYVGSPIVEESITGSGDVRQIES
jgi:hypothetical protein